MKKNKSKLNWFDKLLLVINCGLCLALLISYLAPVADPRKFWLIAFFGLAYPPLLLANVLMLIYWLLRRSRWILLPVITIFLGWNVLKNNIGFSWSGGDVALGDSSTIRAMTYNVHNFKKYGSDNEVWVKQEILQVIKEQQPDIIGMQEFYSRKRGEYAMVDSMKQIMNTGHYYFEKFMDSQKEAIGMAIFSKYPIVGKGFIHLTTEPGSGNQCLYVDVKKGEQTLRWYSVHLQSINFEPQDYKYLDTITKSGKTDISSTKRLGAKLKHAFLKRAEQVFVVKQHAQQCPYPYVISGDFNDTPSSFAVNQMAKGIQNAFLEKGRGLGRTYNGDFPNYQIDYIMASPQFKVASYNVIKKKLSDHFPVCVNLRLK